MPARHSGHWGTSQSKMVPALAQRHAGVKGASRGLGVWSSVRGGRAGGAASTGVVLPWGRMGGAGAGVC